MEKHYLNTPKYISDETHLHVIFPEEIWLLIFNKIKDYNHYHCIDTASPYFHKLLLPLRTRFLFPEVIKLCSNSMVSSDESYFSLLQCRSLCKTWRQGVDATLHQILSETNTDATEWTLFGNPSAILNKNQERIIYQPDIYNQSKLDKFLEVFHNSHFLTGSNPFPSRSIQINIRAELTIHNRLLDILQVYGHHIWHCYVRFWFDNPDKMQQGVLIFLKFLSLLPLLQTLRINNVSITDRNHNTENLERILTANPMPKFKNLKLLVVHHVAGPVFFRLIQNNTHIKKLRISEMDFFSTHSALLSTPLPNLEELHILSFEGIGDILRLLSVKGQWPLKILTILCHPIVRHVNNVLSWIEESWTESLTELNLIIPAAVSVLETKSSLKLRSLKILRIQMERYACLDFILQLSESLVSLSVYHAGMDTYDDSLEKNSKIEFFSHMENLGKSNIWKFFPRLKDLNYADDSVCELPCGRAYKRYHWVGYYFEGM